MKSSYFLYIIYFLTFAIFNIFEFIYHNISSENGEPIQMLRYEHGQKYERHFDCIHDKGNQKVPAQRIATVLMYLSNVEKGGETIFPFSEVNSF